MMKLNQGCFIRRCYQRLSQGWSRRNPNDTILDERRCPGCKAWLGAWRGATWHEENCPYELTT